MALKELSNFENSLRQRVKGKVSFDEVTRGVYATDASIYQIMPVAVIEPRDEADVIAAVEQRISKRFVNLRRLQRIESQRDSCHRLTSNMIRSASSRRATLPFGFPSARADRPCATYE